jgi:hypothetical protein
VVRIVLSYNPSFVGKWLLQYELKNRNPPNNAINREDNLMILYFSINITQNFEFTFKVNLMNV